MRRVASTVLALVILSSAASAEAATVTVTNATELRAAVAAAEPGTEIVLQPGTYTISGSNVACSASGTAAAPIVVRSATPLAAKLELSTLEGFVVSGAHWHFEGLDVKGTCANDSDCEHAFHVVGGASGFVLRSNRIVDFNAQLKVNASLGGKTPTFAHDGLVEGNELFDSRARNTSNPVTKLNIDTGDRWIVRANYIHDFHRKDGSPSYGAFMKSGGKDGLFERNLVLCTKDDATAGTHIGLSFGGGGTGAQYCAPAFDKNVPCAVEHENGTMRNNVIASCSDVGIYLNRGKNTKLLFNTLVATTGIDFRFDTTTGESRGNVLTGQVKDRDKAKHTAVGDLANVSAATFEAMYMDPLAGDLRKKGDLSAILGKSTAVTDVPDDYCGRTRTGSWDLGALQHSLGDCATVLPPLGSSGGPGGASSGDAGAGGPGGSSGGGSSGDPNGGASSGDPNGAAPGDGAGDDSGCATAPGGRSEVPVLAVAASAIAIALVRRRRH